nr:hypothetical protein [bacterium]
MAVGILAFFIAFLVDIVIVCLYSAGDPLSYLNGMMRFVLIAFGLFLFLGYEIAAKLRECRMAEALFAAPGERARYYGAAWLCLAVLAFAFAIVMFGSVVIFCAVYRIWYGAFIWHVAGLCFLYAFLTPVTAAAMGMVMGIAIKKRYLAYVLCALWILSNTSYFEQILLVPDRLMGWPAGSTALYRINDLFFLTPQALGIMPDYLYGVPMEPGKWFTVIFWLCLALALGCIYLVRFRKNTRIWSSAAALAAAAICLAGFVVNDHCVKMDWRPDTDPMYDDYYYAAYTPPQDAPGFTIQSYDIKLKIGNGLKARVTMAVSPLSEQKTQYHFTLYHRFAITGASNAAGDIPFTQTGDEVYINAADIPDGILTLEYEGYSVHYYSNRQGICLPGYFPYYPFEGDKIIHRGSDHWDTEIPQTAREFTVSVDSPLKLFANLPGDPDRPNHFSGQAQSLTLMAGMMERLDEKCDILGSPVDGGYQLVRMDVAIEAANTWAQAVSSRMDGHMEMGLFPKEHIWIVSNAFYRASLGEDVVLLDGYSFVYSFHQEVLISTLAQRYIFPGREGTLYGCLRRYLRDSDSFLADNNRISRKDAIKRLHQISQGETLGNQSDVYGAFAACLAQVLQNDQDDALLQGIYDEIASKNYDDRQAADYVLSLMEEVG